MEFDSDDTNAIKQRQSLRHKFCSPDSSFTDIRSLSGTKEAALQSRDRYTLKLHWRISGRSNGRIIFGLEYSYNVDDPYLHLDWIGIGVGAGMDQADMIIANFKRHDNNGDSTYRVLLDQYFSDTYAEPALKFDLLEEEPDYLLDCGHLSTRIGNENKFVHYVQFSRRLRPSRYSESDQDEQFDNIIVTGRNNNFIYAFGTQDLKSVETGNDHLHYHGPNNRGQFILNVPSNIPVIGIDNLVYSHDECSRCDDTCDFCINTSAGCYHYGSDPRITCGGAYVACLRCFPSCLGCYGYI